MFPNLFSTLLGRAAGAGAKAPTGGTLSGLIGGMAGRSGVTPPMGNIATLLASRGIPMQAPPGQKPVGFPGRIDDSMRQTPPIADMSPLPTGQPSFLDSMRQYKEAGSPPPAPSTQGYDTGPGAWGNWSKGADGQWTNPDMPAAPVKKLSSFWGKALGQL